MEPSLSSGDLCFLMLSRRARYYFISLLIWDFERLFLLCSMRFLARYLFYQTMRQETRFWNQARWLMCFSVGSCSSGAWMLGCIFPSEIRHSFSKRILFSFFLTMSFSLLSNCFAASFAFLSTPEIFSFSTSIVLSFWLRRVIISMTLLVCLSSSRFFISSKKGLLGMDLAVTVIASIFKIIYYMLYGPKTPPHILQLKYPQICPQSNLMTPAPKCSRFLIQLPFPDNFIMQVSARTIKTPVLLRRALSDPSAAIKVLSFNPETPTPESQSLIPTSPTLHKMHSQTLVKEEDKEQISAIENNLDDLFSKLARLNSELNGDAPSTDNQLKTSQQAGKKKHKRSFKLETLPEGAVKPTEYLSMLHFQLGNPLGEGKFGDVLQLIHKDTGMIFALKKIFKSMVDEYQMQQQIIRQIQCLKQLSHPNIIKLYGGFTDPYHIFLITQYIHGETLDKFYCSDYNVVSKILFQLLKAIEYMHSNFIVHRDIKPQNLLYMHGVVKLCDFGWATNFKNTQPNEFCGTLDYVSPEVAEKKHYNGSVDMWSVGILAFEMLTGHVPFKDQSRKVHLENIVDCENREILYPGWMSGEAREFIGRLLRKEPLMRMTVQEAMNHPFIKKYQTAEIIPNDIGDLVFDS